MTTSERYHNNPRKATARGRSGGFRPTPLLRPRGYGGGALPLRSWLLCPPSSVLATLVPPLFGGAIKMGVLPPNPQHTARTGAAARSCDDSGWPPSPRRTLRGWPPTRHHTACHSPLSFCALLLYNECSTHCDLRQGLRKCCFAAPLTQVTVSAEGGKYEEQGGE